MFVIYKFVIVLTFQKSKNISCFQNAKKIMNIKDFSVLAFVTRQNVAILRLSINWRISIVLKKMSYG